MTRSKRTSILGRAALVPLAALTFAGTATGFTAASASTGSDVVAKARPATVRVANTNLGKVLVNSKGRTLYLFEADSGTTSSCVDACAAAWPPARVSGAPKVGKGAKGSLAVTTQRSDGNPQVTYNGHPLYTYSGDRKAGDTNGQGLNAFGGLWHAVSPAGNEITQQPSGGSGGSSGGGY
jgi:predicted lipoprotein with Yx(FWY)xxD motif